MIPVSIREEVDDVRKNGTAEQRGAAAAVAEFWRDKMIEAAAAGRRQMRLVPCFITRPRYAGNTPFIPTKRERQLARETIEHDGFKVTRGWFWYYVEIDPGESQ